MKTKIKITEIKLEEKKDLIKIEKEFIKKILKNKL
jgi:hypothetical protein